MNFDSNQAARSLLKTHRVSELRILIILPMETKTMTASTDKEIYRLKSKCHFCI